MEKMEQGADYKRACFDDVYKPEHYASGSIEPIDVMEDIMPPEYFAGFLWGCVIKYMLRWQHKGGLLDLKKAARYLDWMMEEVKKEPYILDIPSRNKRMAKDWSEQQCTTDANAVEKSLTNQPNIQKALENSLASLRTKREPPVQDVEELTKN